MSTRQRARVADAVYARTRDGHSDAGNPVSDVGHIPVLLDEVIDALGPSSGETFADGTSGRGGHALAIAERLAPGGRLIVNDMDPGNAAFASERVRAGVSGVNVATEVGNFADLPRKFTEQRVLRSTVSSWIWASRPTRWTTRNRGFSFMRDGALDMRYDRSIGVSASEFLAMVSEAELESVLREYGEERQARRIARKLVEIREESPITSTSQLASIVAGAVGGRAGHGRIHPATRVFQALRIAVNDELASLRSILESIGRSCAATKRGTGTPWLARGARIAVISFHSLEDRPVKRAFAELEERGLATRLTRRPVTAGEDEVKSNPRSRSAKLRAIRIE